MKKEQWKGHFQNKKEYISTLGQNTKATRWEKRPKEKMKNGRYRTREKKTFFFSWETLELPFLPFCVCVKKYLSPHHTVWPLSHLWPWQGLSASEALCSERLPPRPHRKSSACWDTRPEPSSEALLQTTSKNMASEKQNPLGTTAQKGRKIYIQSLKEHYSTPFVGLFVSPINVRSKHPVHTRLSDMHYPRILDNKKGPRQYG